MQETMVQILDAFPAHPHLRMAVAALAVLKEDKLLAKGYVKAFEMWVYAYPALHNDLDNCRHFLQALCPRRFDHTQKSRNWENVVEKFPEASQLLIQAIADTTKPAICLDFAPQARMGLPRPGKKARAALEIADKVMSAYADEKGYKLVGVDERDADKTPCFSFIPTLSVSKIYTIKATSAYTAAYANAVADALEKAGRSLALTEEEGSRIHIIGGVNEFVVVFPVHATDYDQITMEEELEVLAKAMFEGESDALLP